MSFLKMAVESEHVGNKSFQIIDTLPLARKYIRDVPNHRLETLKDYLNIPVESHEAIQDCFVTHKVYEYLIGNLLED